MRVLVVEDDVALCAMIRRRLMEQGFVVDMVHDGVEAETLAQQGVHDVVVLDLGLPSRNGLSVLRTWRRAGLSIPTIILSARNSWQEKIEGIEAGADDYLGKPFAMAELVTRIKALLRRSYRHNQAPLATSSFTLDEGQQAVLWHDGRSVALTATEFRLLRCLMLSAGRIVTKEYLLDHIYDFDDEHEHDHNVIEVHILNLRKKIGHGMIVTKRHQGYLFQSEATPVVS
ncbi:MAG: response regulator transcription factor [Magnetococcales bacterium]|nr:response regulator transcription factor [Magnetococcales bacterium]